MIPPLLTHNKPKESCKEVYKLGSRAPLTTKSVASEAVCGAGSVVAEGGGFIEPGTAARRYTSLGWLRALTRAWMASPWQTKREQGAVFELLALVASRKPSTVQNLNMMDPQWDEAVHVLKLTKPSDDERTKYFTDWDLWVS
jgi:hypothetical protein